MGLTKILPHLAVSATLLLPTTTCPLTLIVASIFLMGTRKRWLSTRFTLTEYRTCRRCSLRDATGARFNQVTDEGVTHASGYVLPVGLSIRTCIYNDSLLAGGNTAASCSNKIPIWRNVSFVTPTSTETDNLPYYTPY